MGLAWLDLEVTLRKIARREMEGELKSEQQLVLTSTTSVWSVDQRLSSEMNRRFNSKSGGDL